MDLKQYRSKLIGNDDERAVSPVIGVILMVAITVILAAVIAAFVLDMGDLDDSAPNAQFDWSTSGGNIDSVTLTSGDDVALSNLAVDGTTEDTGDIDDSNIGASTDETWTAGETLQFDGSDTEVTITWEGDGTSTIIAEHEA